QSARASGLTSTATASTTQTAPSRAAICTTISLGTKRFSAWNSVSTATSSTSCSTARSAFSARSVSTRVIEGDEIASLRAGGPILASGDGGSKALYQDQPARHRPPSPSDTQRNTSDG